MNENCASITWAINNYSYCWQKNDEPIISPLFSLYRPQETKWKLLLFPRGVASDDGFIALYLYRTKDCNGPEIIKLKYSLDIVTTDGICLADVALESEFRKNVRHGSPRYELKLTKTSKYLLQDVLTIRCQFNEFDGKMTERRHIFARTIIGIEERLIQWSVGNFSEMALDQTQIIQMKSKPIDPIMQINLAVRSDNQENISFGVYSFDQCMKYLAVKTFILNYQKKEINSGEFECWFDCGKCQMFPLTITKNHLIGNKSIFLPNDVLTLSFQLRISTGISFEGIEKAMCAFLRNPFPYGVVENRRKCITHEMMDECPCPLITDLTSLFKDQNLCDMKLKTKTTDFPVHTSILGARSPVFRAMFSSDMKEKVNGYVDVFDLEDETVRRFLLYWYSNQLGELKWDDALQLYKVADKYVVKSLKDKCSLFFKSNLNLENACEAFILSDFHLDKDLKEIAQNFILKNGKEMFKSEEWKLLADANSKLALETMLRNWIEE